MSILFCHGHFSSHQRGAHNATLDMLTDAANDFPGAPVGRFRYTLTGTGAVGPVVSFNPASPLNLGSLSVGSTGVPQNVRLTNTGTSPLNITTLTTGGTNPGDFVFSNNCSAGAIVTGGSCIISATFRPTAAGARSARRFLSPMTRQGRRKSIPLTALERLAPLSPLALPLLLT